MKVFTDPKVYLIAEPKINWEGVRQFLGDMDNYSKKTVNEAWIEGTKPSWHSDHSDADLLPEFCGRMCYCSFGERQGRTSNQAYLENIIKSGHGSVLEHANFTFLITQCSRGFTHEMVRHRAGFAYSQESTHYIDYNEENGRIVLDVRLEGSGGFVGLGHAMEEVSKKALQVYEEVYQSLKSKGYKKKEACSMARQVLPIGIEAKIAFTANIRAIRHFCLTRGNLENVLEIRKVAVEVFKIMLDKAPNSMQGLSLYIGEDGVLAIRADFGTKV